MSAFPKGCRGVSTLTWFFFFFFKQGLGNDFHLLSHLKSRYLLYIDTGYLLNRAVRQVRALKGDVQLVITSAGII